MLYIRFEYVWFDMYNLLLMLLSTHIGFKYNEMRKSLICGLCCKFC